MTAPSSLSIREAADILGIAKQAGIKEIRSRYHALVKEWHPDVSHTDPVDSHKAMVQINTAYDTQFRYCMNYEFSFSPEDIRCNTPFGPDD